MDLDSKLNVKTVLTNMYHFGEEYFIFLKGFLLMDINYFLLS